MVKMRLMGTKEELEEYRKILEEETKFKVIEFSEYYPIRNSSKFYRVYIELVENI